MVDRSRVIRISRRDCARILAVVAVAGCGRSHPPVVVPCSGRATIPANADRDTIQRAIDGARRGGIVHFPAGVYIIEGTLDVTGARGLVLSGEDARSVLLFDTKNASIGGSDVQGLVVQDLAIGGSSGQAIAVTGTAATPSRDVTVERCGIRGADRAATPAPAGVFLLHVEHASVRECTFAAVGYADHKAASLCILVQSSKFVEIVGNVCDARAATMGIGLEDTSDSSVVRNTVEGSLIREDLGAWGYGIYFYRIDGPPARNVCASNHVRNTQGTGIYVAGAPFTIVHGNTVESTCLRVTGVTLATGGIALNSPATDCVVADNVVSITGNATRPCPGIRFDAARTRVIGNRVSRTSGDGIQYNVSPSGSVITDNDVSDSGDGGITSPSGLSATRGLVIAGNTVTNTGNRGPGIACQGLAPNDVSDLTIDSNTVRRASGAGISAGNVTRLVITENIVTTAGRGAVGYAGIYVAACRDGTVVGNEASGSESPPPSYGIHVAGGATLRILDNDVHGNAIAGVHVAAAAAVTDLGNR
jgi:parallel beta-helix repeat protein